MIPRKPKKPRKRRKLWILWDHRRQGAGFAGQASFPQNPQGRVDKQEKKFSQGLDLFLGSSKITNGSALSQRA